MWTTLTPDILARFPRQRVNGAANGVHTDPAIIAQGNWDARIAELAVFRTYTDDWDGQAAAGLASPAAAIGGELVDSAVALATDAPTARDTCATRCVSGGAGYGILGVGSGRRGVRVT